MKTLIWLDDCRDPFKNPEWLNYSPIGKDVNIIWCKSYDEFVNEINKRGLPDGICFDHDLGDQDYHILDNMMSEPREMTGYDCAKWLVIYCIVYKKELPKWNIQSSNSVGAENIRRYLTNFEKHYESN